MFNNWANLQNISKYIGDYKQIIEDLFIYINAGQELEWGLWKEFSSNFMMKTLTETEIDESNDLFKEEK